MTEPTRVRCEYLDLDDLIVCAAQNVTREKHLVFEIAPLLLPNGKQSQREIVKSLALALPHCHVFDAGSRQGLQWISVVQVIDEAEIITHQGEIVLAAQSFRQLANELMARQSAKFGVALGAISHDFDYGEQCGQLDDNWSYFFHGWECAFKSKDGQAVDVRLEFAPEYGVLDAYFFFQFLHSTPQFETLSGLFLQPYHDMTRVLETLHRRDKLRLLTLHCSEGFVAPNGEL